MDPQVSPDGTVSLKLTDPAKWFRAATVIVKVVEFPAFAEAGDVAAIVKSRNWKKAVAGWMREPLVPVTVRV
jgi:hypothetical protein